ncbi:MAG TPA: IPT/TIG domain-containing protein [Thermoanaerobaculia bacterium]|nr:IPT/TIG domain-containing protein [Thermoanaerobaculia bacterium]
MRKFIERKHWFALLAILFVFAACKGESPTAPPVNSGGGGGVGGGGTPPTNASIVLTTSSTDPLIDSTATITATVTVNGQPVANGTAVEFSVSPVGAFSDTGTTTTIKTTTNGVATASVSSTTAGATTVTATVNNVSRTTQITFRDRPIVQPPPDTTPTITSITPAVGRPAGGETIRITGTNFRAPVRVVFNINGSIVEGIVTSVTATTIDVLTPPVNIGIGQQVEATVSVITEAGTATEQRVVSSSPFTFRNEVLTPNPVTASPSSGPIGGGTRVTIFGDGFQSPVQVFFGAAEARVIDVGFSQIIVESPIARSTSPNGAGSVTGPVDIRVLNIASNKTATLTAGFRYVDALSITAIRPFSGSALGGTDITIDGTGFESPLQVTVGGVLAQQLRVSGTQILVRTNPKASPCSNSTGPVTVTTINNNQTVSSTELFTYIGIPSTITAVGPGGGVQPGGTATVTVNNPGVGPLGVGDIRFTVNGVTVTPSPSQVTDGTGSQTFSFVVPNSGFTFPTVACQTGGGLAGTQFGPIDVTLGFTNTSTSCTDTLTNGLHILPSGANPCLTPASPSVTAPAGGSCATPSTASVTGVGFPATTQSIITISNATGAQPLNITNVAISGGNAAEFRITPTSASNIAAGGSQNFTLTFDPTTAGVKDATVTFTTNSTTNPTVTVCVSATAAP